jgi:lantibiotic biosynthesis protein
MASATPSGLDASGFFVLRTPLLPFDELRAWSDGLQAPAAHASGADLERALTADRALLNARLRVAWRRPELREALFLASPELDAALQRSETAADVSDGAARALRSFVAYFARMTARSTPFGLFAGCSVGTLAAQTALELVSTAHYQRHTRLDMDYLTALVSALEADPSVRPTLRYAPNSSLYPAGGRLHYAESRLGKYGRSYHLVAIEETPELVRTLASAAGGATLDALASGLVDDTVSPVEAREFIDELASSQILVSDLGPRVTGQEAIHALIARLASHTHTLPVADRLERVRDDLTDVDRAGVGGNPNARYAAIQASLQALPATPEVPRLFQVDMVKPAARLSLGPLVVAELERGVTLLQRLGYPRNQGGALETFMQRFVDRYEGAEVPLVDVLDEEIGIGFASSVEPGGEPLLQGLHLPSPLPESAAWHPHHAVLLRLLSDALARSEQEVALQPADVDALAATEPVATLPDALEVLARLAATSSEAVDRGEFRVWFQAASGPSGARLLGRFCHADTALHRQVVDHLRTEEAHRPDAVFAEIVHLPEGRLGNILSRPVLRAYEIPFLGQSGAAGDRHIPVTDLRVSVQAGRVVLRSARLDREVVPRLTTAHNFTLRSLGLYRFLCALQQQGVTPGLAWSWGPLESAPFLPRVVSGRLVLARACWNLTRSAMKSIVDARGTHQFAVAQQVRQRLRLPRYVALADGDNELVVDLDNVLSVDAFVHLLKGRDQARLEELFPEPDELCVQGPKGRFVHELIVPFVKTSVVSAAAPMRPAAPVRRQFPPGSEWLYAKLYTGRGIADRLLVDTLRPLIDNAVACGVADGWFFIRYADPEPHVRLRLHGDPLRLTSEFLPHLAASLEPLVEGGRVARWQLDTYVREVERYGGAQGIALAEQLFCLDSECVLAMLESTPGDDGLNWRWKLAMCGVDLLLDGLGLDLQDKCDWARQRRDAFAHEFRADGHLKQQLGDKFRAERGGLGELWRLARGPAAGQYPALEALHRRGERLAPVAEDLRALDRDGQLGVPIQDLAASYAHMHVNRLLRSAHRFQELTMYDLLDRIYRSQRALGGAG